MIVFKVALVDTFSDTEIAVGEKKKYLVCSDGTWSHRRFNLLAHSETNQADDKTQMVETGENIPLFEIMLTV